MALTRDQVLHIAQLARLAISEKETRLFAQQLSEILDHFEMLDRLDTSEIPPTAHAVDLANVLRRDTVTESLPREKALENAPRQRDGFFQVRRILD